jgi:hypothetical protein
MSNDARGGIGGFLIAGVLTIAIVGLVAYFVVVRYAQSPPPRPLPAEVQAHFTKATSLADKGDACAAETAWDDGIKALDQLADHANFAADRAMAERNRTLAHEACKPPARLDKLIVKDRKADERPAEIRKDDLLKYYPVGRTVKSAVLLRVGGRGMNQDWGFRGEEWFQSSHEIEGEMKIEKNDGREVEALLHVLRVQKLLAHSKTEFELALPDTPLLALLWKEAEIGAPQLRLLRTTFQGLQAIDPHLRKTLTGVVEIIRPAGKGQEGQSIELISEIDKLSGSKLRVKYVNGFGITQIEALEGKSFDQATLQRLADGLSLFLDYSIFPDTTRKVGDRWTVKAREVAGLFPFWLEYDIDGSLDLRLDGRDEKKALLKAEKGELILKGRGRDVEDKTVIDLKEGNIDFDLADLTVENARLKLELKSRAESIDHLLFQMQKVRDLSIQSTYSAKRTPR